MKNSSGKAMPVGGGVKKIVYALNTMRRMGLMNSQKALRANNTCKACGLGMGGQEGGMINEMHEYPSVCNKSIQAQSTDLQSPIPDELFDHPLDDFKDLTPHELEHLGRLGKPIFKEKSSNRFRVVDWDWAIDYAAKKFSNTPAARSFFYSSGRSSNEAGFVLQLFARLYGTNNVTNCSYYCHQATSEGLGTTIGAGTATVELEDLSLCDAIFVIGANPASNHPRFIHKLKACRDRGGEVIVINPAKEPGLIKFALPKSMRSIITGGSDIASVYVQPKIGGDLALFKGIAKYLIENNHTAPSFIEQYTQGYDAFLADINDTSWTEIEKLSGVAKVDIEVVAQAYARSKNAVFAWGMGMTHHLNGVENIEYIANLALMRGMIGAPGRGLLPLRGHSNVQGIGTIGVKPVLPEYIFQGLQTELNVSFPEAPEGLDTLACLERAAEGKMDAALILGGNLYQATPNSVWAKQALDKVGFKVYLTTTLNAGHVHVCDNSDALILPVMARDEEAQPTTQESMFNYVRLSDGGITRLAHVRSEVDILTSIAVKTLPPEQFDMSVFKSHQSIRETIANVVPGMEELADISVAKHEFHVRNRVMHTPEFKTDNGKGQFVVHPLIDNSKADYPFTLMSVRSEGQFNSIIYEENDSYRGVDNRWTVLLNPDDMKAMALSAGDKIDVVSAHGVMKSVHAQPFDIPQGNVMAYYPEANVLIGLERDKRSHTPAFKSVSVKLVY
jgi:molybdopterin-dependent oxidoreductase alpha subunit